MPRRYVKKPQMHCAHCGAPVSSAGRPSKSGKRYCAGNKECQAARLREHGRARDRAPATYEVERRPCSYCGRALPHRAKRRTDLDEGRWCLAHECQRAKRRALEDSGRWDSLSSEQKDEAKRRHEEYLQYIRAEFEAATVGPCSECGRPDAREDYQHPTPDMARPCKGRGLEPNSTVRSHPKVPEHFRPDEMHEIWSVVDPVTS